VPATLSIDLRHSSSAGRRWEMEFLHSTFG